MPYLSKIHLMPEDALIDVKDTGARTLISNETSARQQADNTITANYQAADNAITADYQAADTSLSNKIGQLTNLATTDKTSIVNAVNEVLGDVGNITSLTTTNKSSVVSAVNELVTTINNLKSTIYINVKDYGAVGDGVTDDTQAINDAKAVAESYEYGATLFFPAGTYLISSTLTFTYQSGNGLGGVSILGEGKYSSIITTNLDIDLIQYIGDETVANYNGYLYGISISEIYLYKAGSGSSSTGISFTYCGMVYMNNVRIRYFKTGVYLSNCGNSAFVKVDISANVINAHGFDVGDRSVSNAYIACSFSASGNASSLTADSVGFYADRGNISDQNILYFDVGGSATVAIKINGANTTTNQTGDLNIIDLVCETYYGLQLYNIARHGNINIIGGWFNCTGERSGIYLTNCNGVKINGAVFTNNIGSGALGSKTAISLADSNSGSIQITNCHIKNQQAFNGGTGGGAVMFTNNIVHIESGVTSADTNVTINAKNSICANNIFRGVMLRCVRFLSSATYSLCTNNVADGRATGTAFQNDAGSTTTFNNNLNG